MIPEPPARGATGLGRAVARSVALGVGVGAAVAVVGQLAGLALYVLAGRDGSYGTFARLGALYAAAFHHVPIVVSVRASGRFTQALGRVSAGLSVRFGVALLLVTLGTAWALVTGTRRLVQEVGSGPRRILVGLAVAPGYALWGSALGALAGGTFPVGATGLGGTAEIRVPPGLAFLFPLLLAGLAALVGAMTVPGSGGAGGGPVIQGGIRAFTLALALAFAGLLVLAAVRPQDTRAYFRSVSSPGASRAVALVGHHVLLLPDQSLWVLIPAMGGCDVVVSGGTSRTLLCPREVSTSSLLGMDVVSAIGGPARTRPLPLGYLAFVLVPVVATIAGGTRAAVVSAGRARGAMAGGLSGVVFAALVTMGIALSTLTASWTFQLLGRASSGTLRAGPEPVRGAVLGLVWGVIGGAIGGACRRPGPSDRAFDAGAGGGQLVKPEGSLGGADGGS